jgi:hypothetical protein
MKLVLQRVNNIPVFPKDLQINVNRNEMRIPKLYDNGV